VPPDRFQGGALRFRELFRRGDRLLIFVVGEDDYLVSASTHMRIGEVFAEDEQTFCDVGDGGHDDQVST